MLVPPWQRFVGLSSEVWFWLTRIQEIHNDMVQRMQAELLKQKVSINEDDCRCQTYSTGSIPKLKFL